MLKKYLSNKENLIVLFIISLFFIIGATVSLHRYWQYEAWYYDFGIFYQAISSVAQLKPPIIDHFVFSDQVIWADHIHPLIFLLSPFVALFPRGETILVLQALFVSVSGFFIYKIANKYTQNFFESISFLVIYFSFIGLHNAVISEFHAITLIVLPLSMFLYGIVGKKINWYVMGLIGILLTKESTFIIPAWFSILLIIQNKGFWRKVGIVTLISSVGYGLFLLKVAFPFFNGLGYYYSSSGSADLLKFQTIFNTQTIKTMFYTLQSHGFLPILAPETLPPILFNWWSRFSGLATSRHTLGLHYNAEISPTLLLATVIGWQRIKKFKLKHIQFIKTHHFRIGLFVLAIFVGILNFQILKSPFLLFGNSAFYKHTNNFGFLDDLVSAIPEEGIILTQQNIAAKIAHRKVYMLRDNYYDIPHDYIVVDLREGQGSSNFYGVQYYDRFVEKISNDLNYKVIYNNEDQKIYKKLQ